MEGNELVIEVGQNSNGATVSLQPSMLNRHGLICGATGTGKTVTLQVLAEQFSSRGIPVFAVDVKGDLSGISQPGVIEGKVKIRAEELGIQGLQPTGFPAVCWDVFRKRGHPLRTTVSEFGPLLLAHLFELNDTQESVLQIAFSVADDEGLLLLDLKDLRSLLTWMSDNRAELVGKYGEFATRSVGAIQRQLLVFQRAGGDLIFGEPAFSIRELLDPMARRPGLIHILDATKLIEDRRVYSALLLWFLSELFEELDEVGDIEQPRLVIFFDEAHLLFADASRSLLEKVEHVVRLVRSKAVGVFFVTQHPQDIPQRVLAQLGNRFIHALRAYTPLEQKALKAAAETFRQNPEVAAEDVLPQLAVGEALVSTLTADGRPDMVERTLIRPPASRIGPVTDEERQALLRHSPYTGKYDTDIDRESAYEKLLQREQGRHEKEPTTNVDASKVRSNRSNRQTPVEAFFKSLVRSAGYSIGRQIVRGILGSISSRGR